MVRSSSAEPAKATKRKGTRSVSTLTPSQLARKRANDREAQRAIRARTKEHIERLERELEDLKSKQSRDQTVQELLRRNKALEDELSRLKENMGVSMTSSPYSTPGIYSRPTAGALQTLTMVRTVYDDSLSTGSGAMPSPRASPFPSGDYGSLPDYGQQYVPLPNNCESWANTVPVPSNVSSPSSSADTDGYGAGYIPTSVPTSMLPSNNTSTSSISAVGHKDIKMEYEDVDHHVHAGRAQSLHGAAAAAAAAAAAGVEHVPGRLLPAGAVLGPLKPGVGGSSSWQALVMRTASASRIDEPPVGFIGLAPTLTHRVDSPDIKPYPDSRPDNP
ncbi:hypothetical protein BGZ61DRAFT_550048 [Ilyonectria robusta]|uniref:uncharacterized protein n=1 Tax=Ilyonectria robusta TaxID=1079257 RepID=UPI001E8CE445|nr:uncharacterized protein BGZ61DRAFT_550048 [Ilyonectria robusta]KAH8684171.1 hypothetical protein BGZ61DRAFT_550048 [Ilyonectria robusta]